jgi:hypothetical protein
VDDWKIVQRVAGLFQEENDVPEQECTAVNGSVYCPQQRVPCIESCVPHANTASYIQPLDQGIIYCMKQEYRRRLVRFLLREIDRDFPAEEVRKWNNLGNPHACSNSKLLCEMWLRH